MQSTTGKKKMKWIYQTKKGFITSSKLVIDELGCCPPRSDNAYFGYNEQACLGVLFCICQT